MECYKIEKIINLYFYLILKMEDLKRLFFRFIIYRLYDTEYRHLINYYASYLLNISKNIEETLFDSSNLSLNNIYFRSKIVNRLNISSRYKKLKV